MNLQLGPKCVIIAGPAVWPLNMERLGQNAETGMARSTVSFPWGSDTRNIVRMNQLLLPLLSRSHEFKANNNACLKQAIRKEIAHNLSSSKTTTEPYR
jgi:hypothetical protein